MSDRLIDQKPVVAGHCPVCDGMMLSFQKYCSDCEKWKEQAESLRKAKARRKAFGDVI